MASSEDRTRFQWSNSSRSFRLYLTAPLAVPAAANSTNLPPLRGPFFPGTRNLPFSTWTRKESRAASKRYSPVRLMGIVCSRHSITMEVPFRVSFTSSMAVPETSSTRTSVSREESSRTVEWRSRRRKLPGVRSSSRRPRQVVTVWPSAICRSTFPSGLLGSVTAPCQ